MKQPRILAFLCMMLFSFSLLNGQTSTTGSVAGVVTDSTSAIIPGAVVVLKSVTTDAKQAVKTSSSGSYRFDLVPPGSYILTVDQTGFSKLETAITVANAQVLGVDLKLTVGSQSQTINVEATGTTLQTENGNVATSVSQAQISEVPNSGNNMTYVTKLTPGMGTQFGVSGSTTLYTVDGMRNNDPYNNSNNSGPSNMMMGVNDVQEATVTGNGYSGQFGGLVGAQVSYVTNSGSNRLHGNLAWFWTGRSLVANTWFGNHTGAPRPFENVNMWQGAISGPAIKDKLFFYADTEGLRAILPSASTTVALPSANLEAYTLKTLAASGLNASIPFYQNMFNIYNAAGAAHNAQPGNSTYSGAARLTGCPTATTSLSAADLGALGTAPGACTNSYQGSAINFANEWLIIARVDAVLGVHDKAFIRYNHDTGSQPTTTDQVSPLFSAISLQPQHSGQLNETHVFGTRVVNNLILSGLWYGALFGPANLPATLALFPAQTSFGDSSLYGLGGSNSSFPTGRNVTTISLQDDVAIDAGNHTLKFGGVAFVVKENDHYFTAGTIPLESIPSLGAFIHGGSDPSTGSTTFTQSFVTKPNHPILYNQLGFYGEDDWKMRRDFNMSFALRIEHQSNVQCLDSCLTLPSSPFPSLTHGAAIPYDQALSFNQKNVLPGLQAIEWEPRVGFAYNPQILNQTLVVRGGAGIFYDGLPGNIVESIVKNSPVKNTFKPSGDNLAQTENSNLFSDAAALNTAFSNSITSGGTAASIKASLPTALQKFFTPPGLYGPQNNFHMYEIYKWNLEVQKSLFRGATTFSVNYLGNHGIHKPYTNAGLNAYSTSIAGLPTTAPDPRFGQVNYIASGGMSNYNGLVTTFTQRFHGGSLFTAGYTYGKSMDTITTGLSSTTTYSTSTLDIESSLDPYNPLSRYAPASSDIRNYLMLNYVYELPFKNFFLGGWQAAGAAFAYSGLPFTVFDSSSTSAIAGSTVAGGNYGGTMIANYNYSGEANCSSPSTQCLTTTQFAKATNISSTGPRNGFRGPGYVSTDLSITKSIPLHWEGGNLNVGVQAFNVLNHPNFKVPNASSFSAQNFGTISATVNPTGIFSGVGGDDSPRILQVRMRLTF